MRIRSLLSCSLAALLACVSLACASTSANKSAQEAAAKMPRGPHGGFMAEQTFMDLFLEAVVTKEGLVFVYAFDEQGNQADLIQYYPRNVSIVELRYPPLGTVEVALGPDRGRGALMAKIDIFKARDIGLSPNVVVMLR